MSEWMVKRIRRSSMIAACLLAAGCGSLIELPDGGPAPSLYNLTPAPVVGSANSGANQLLIAEPSAARGLDTNRIARRPSATELQFFAGARWSQRLPRMVEGLFLEALEESGAKVTTTRAAAGIPADYRIQVEIRDFQAEYFDGGQVPDIRVRLNVRIIRLGPLQIVASKSFEATIPAPGAQMPGIIDSFNRASRDVVAQSTAWLNETLE